MAILADSINNNGIYAVRAESDKDGNRIDTVYAKKTEIPSKTSDLTNDSGFVSSSDLATVAETGSYADLSNKPTIPSGDELVPAATAGTDTGKVLTVDNQGSPAWVTPSAGTVYTAGDGVDITNDVISADVDGTTIGIDASTKKLKSLQVIPTKTSDLQNDSNFVVSSSLAVVATSGSYADLLNKPSIPAAQVNSDWNASSGVAEILNKPTIPTVDQTYNASSTNAQSGTAVAQAIASITPAQTCTAGDGIDITNDVISADVDGTTIGIDSSTKKIKLLSTIPAAQVNSDWNASSGVAQILNKPSLATVASTGAYSDLTGTPTTKPLVAGSNITITENTNDVTISAAGGTVDQTYNSSSANAQSGTAVAGAIAGVNQVPSSSASDENKVLTVNSSGTPVWAEAQGGGTTSEFPYDPGYMHTGWNKMIVRFGDTTYDPTTKTSASKFRSITAMSDPGVYEYTFKSTFQSMSDVLRNEWNDITNNPVDILQLTSDDSFNGGNYQYIFFKCSGLRSVWNMRGNFGNLSNWFQECENLEIVSGKILDRSKSSEIYSPYDIYLSVNSLSYTFYKCSALKRVELIIVGSRATLESACRECSSLEVGPGLFGLFTSLAYTFYDCPKMKRLYGYSDVPDLFYFSNYLLSNPASYNYEISANSAFNGCREFNDFNGSPLHLFGPIWDLTSMFSGCASLKAVPPIVVSSAAYTTMSSMCSGAYNLVEIPDIDYTKITNASYAFSACASLIDVNGLTGLSTACTNVDAMLDGCWSVRRGCTALYTALSASGSAVTNHDYTFSQAGVASGNNVLSTIPSSWGGTGA